MAHITFVHGIGNKPPEGKLLEIWQDSLRGGDVPIDFSNGELTSSMVYWADVLYASPLEVLGPEEMSEGLEVAALRGEKSIDDLEIRATDLSELRWINDLSSKFKVGALLSSSGSYVPLEGESDGSFERVPLPGLVKRRFLKVFLRDVHHYLFNETHKPGDGPSYRVQDEIRARFLQNLQSSGAESKPHIVISHSMGTVIAYDCLKRVNGCPAVDALITIGSPLGLDEIQEKLQPEWTRIDGYPSAKVSNGWLNFFDDLDPVAVLDPFLKNDFRRNGDEVISDVHEPNYGKWRHDVTKYFSGVKFRSALNAMLSP